MINEFHDWYDKAKKGAWFTYYRGDLAYDRYVPLNKPPTPMQRELNMVANMAAELELQRDIILVQHKHAKNDYEYIAVKR